MNKYNLSKNKQDQWSLKRQGADRATQNFGDTNKKEAIQRAADLLRKSQEPASLKIHGLNGRIQEERTYPRKADPSQSVG